MYVQNRREKEKPITEPQQGVESERKQGHQLVEETERRKDVERRIQWALQIAEEEKEHALNERDVAQRREREAREVAERERKRTQQLIEETERRVETVKMMEEALHTAKREKEQALKERDVAQRREREAREVARVKRERNRIQQLIEVQTVERMKEALQTAEGEKERAKRERDTAQRREIEAREVAERERRKAEEAEAEAKELGMQWVVGRREIQLTDVELGRGGWGAVSVANFRGIQVAAKCLYKDLSSSYYRVMFNREMNMAARLRHPNLVQFIGASIEGNPIILTELMKASLREELENERIKQYQVKSINLGVARALNYLHLMQPDSIIHRDISSANVLLDPLPDNQWKAKVTDYGSVNLQQKLHTKNPGSPVYSAPEANTPALQSPKMDIFSFGVLLVEMLTSTFPEVSSQYRLIASIDHAGYQRLIQQCLSKERDERPSAEQLLATLNDF